MSDPIASDRTILDLLRRNERMTIVDFERALGVTATAVRQRLNRLLGSGDIEREVDPSSSGRGRPSHAYRLTMSGQRRTGTNFADLATALWDEIRTVQDEAVKRGLLQRLAVRLADAYRAKVGGGRPVEKMNALAGAYAERQIPFEVSQRDGELPVLTALACPYPDLAERDRSVCAMERMMFSELFGQRVSLDECRLDGASCCTFQLQEQQGEEGGPSGR